jgi:phosphate transport system substrate-binding protein
LKAHSSAVCVLLVALAAAAEAAGHAGAGQVTARQVAAGRALPAYRPQTAVQGTFRICGSPADAALIGDLSRGFERFHPALRMSATLYGPESTMAGLYNGVADLAFMAREMRLPVESMAFEWVYRYKPFEVEIANAGLSPQRAAANLAVFVHKANPLSQISLVQLEAILGSEHLRSSKNMRTWNELGLGPNWADKPIHVYGPRLDSADALFVRRAVLADSHKWNPDYRESASDHETFAALARDPLGIAYAPLDEGHTDAKPLALGERDSGPFYALTAQTIAAHTYPLTRVVKVVLNRIPDKPVEPNAKEFLRYLLSRDGQDAIARDGAHIPLSAEDAQLQLQRLE